MTTQTAQTARTARRATSRIAATDAALELITALGERHGPLMFHQSGGCCDGSSPMCYPLGEFRVGASDVHLGDVGGTPVYIGAAQFEAWRHTHLTLDVVPGRGAGFSVEAPEGVRFVIRSRVLTDDEIADLDAESARLDHWATQARRRLSWTEDFHTTLRWNEPFAEWFVGGRLNAAANCLDRHVADGRGDRVAYHWEGDPGDTRTVTYAELADDVAAAASMLRGLGVEAGDRVAIYLPMVPELPVAMLACARIGAAHSVVFGGFSAHSLADRIDDAGARVLVTADGGYRKGKVIPLKEMADEALATAPVDHVVVVPRLDRDRSDTPMLAGRDRWWDEALAVAPPAGPPEAFDAEQLLFLLHTSGTTGAPKGVMHTTGGYLTQVATTMAEVFDVRPETDVYWCTADIGWITGHSYVVYGPLLNGMTSVLFEGTPDFPDNDRYWSVVERYGVTILYTAPTAIRLFMRWGTEPLQRHDLSSLRVLGSVGEIINPEAWRWYREHIGGGRTPVVDTWWQTETGAIMVSPDPTTPVLSRARPRRPVPGSRSRWSTTTATPSPRAPAT